MKKEMRYIVTEPFLTPDQLRVEKAYIENRRQKAKKVASVLRSYYTPEKFPRLWVLDIGCSVGVIAEYLSRFAHKVVGVDIDEDAIKYARKKWASFSQLQFHCHDCLSIPFADEAFDVIICNGVYEHVADPGLLITEIYRLLKSGGRCYFAAMNKWTFQEPHYRIPFLSLMPRKLANFLVRRSGKASHYDVSAVNYWNVKKLVSRFHVEDITLKVIQNPAEYNVEGLKDRSPFVRDIAVCAAKLAYPFLPTYLLVLQKT